MRRLLLTATMIWPLTVTAAPGALEKDLALLLPASDRDRIAAVSPWFEDAWLERVQEAFLATSVGDALQTESGRDEWQLVSVRIAPCQPLLPYITPRNDQLCSAEIRLVWQPIEQSPRGSAWSAFYADDRAIHALYDADETLLLDAAAAARYGALRQRAKTLNASETAEFASLQRRLAGALVADVLALRGSEDPTDYAGLGERPEFGAASSRASFVSRLKAFLQRHAAPARLKELTAFSLPEGRQPPLLDEWVFLAFEPSRAGRDLKPKSIAVTSRKDGRLLFDLGGENTGSMRRDDPRLYDALDGMAEDDASELRTGVLLSASEPTAKKRAIADAAATQVPHTTCASCHKLNDLAFDFHNLSYLENRPMTISPRVVGDVARELEWLARDR
jgi:hypothetical protein